MTLRHRPHRILYVPADDRPCSVQWPRLLCQLVDWDLLHPPVQLLGWFTRPGEIDEIGTWMSEAARVPLDGVLLSLDMLAYGGYFSSRLPTTRTALAQERMKGLAEIRRLVGDAPVVAFASIMGLTTITRSDETARYVEGLREFSQRANAGVYEILDHAEPLDDLGTGVPEAVLGEYLALRKRNHELNRQAVKEVAEGNLDLLVLAQDESAPEGLHKYEQERLAALAEELGVADRLRIVSGGPELATLLIARLIHQHMNKTPRVRVVYSSEEGSRVFPPLEDRPVQKLVLDAVDLLGGEIIHEGPADITALVNCPVADDSSGAPARTDREAAAAALLAAGEEAAAGRGLAVLDVALAGSADDALAEQLLDSDVELARLLAYSAWGRASGTLASGLAHAALRVISLQDKGAFDLAQLVADITPMRYLALLDALIASEKAQVTLLFSRLVEDWLYQSRIRPLVEEHLVGLLRESVVDLRRMHEIAEHVMRDVVTGAAADLWIEHFLGRTSVDIGLEPHRSSLRLAELEETRLRLPWRRLAEIEIEVDFSVELVAG